LVKTTLDVAGIKWAKVNEELTNHATSKCKVAIKWPYHLVSKERRVCTFCPVEKRTGKIFQYGMNKRKDTPFVNKGCVNMISQSIGWGLIHSHIS